MHESQRELPANGKSADANLTTDDDQVGMGNKEVGNTPISPTVTRDGDTDKKLDAAIQAENHLRKAIPAEMVVSVVPDGDSLLAVVPEPEIQIQGPLPEPKSLWQELPVPEGSDKHEAYFEKGTGAPHKLKLIGARVRGKSHKHAGTNCDDWFEFGFARDWTIMAVADGVGQRKLSRVGAKEACRAAVKKLEEDLRQVMLAERTGIVQFRKRGKDGKFPDLDMNQVEQSLFRAMDAAYRAIEEARDARKEVKEYIDLLGHEPDVHDFSTTLLLAVHNCFTLEDTVYDFVMSLQVGDGMIAAVNVDNKVTLLAKPDSGEFAGQVIPITNPKIRDEKEMRIRIYSTTQRLKAVMLMTDGVADDYFPENTGMLRLYDDLVKNEIIIPAESANQAAKKDIEKPIAPEEELRKWLDTYYIKGSFDDRTVVVLFREASIWA